MMIVSGIFFIFNKVAKLSNIITIQDEKIINIIVIVTISIAIVLLVYSIVIFSKTYFQIALVIGQTFPLTKMMEGFFSQNLKTGYWVIGGWREDAKQMYEQATNLILKIQESKPRKENI
ncbi:MAG: hypothetical protein ACTSQE_11130 [Candidatus Heimdallarchaeaceae archaeon]